MVGPEVRVCRKARPGDGLGVSAGGRGATGMGGLPPAGLWPTSLVAPSATQRGEEKEKGGAPSASPASLSSWGSRCGRRASRGHSVGCPGSRGGEPCVADWAGPRC